MRVLVGLICASFLLVLVSSLAPPPAVTVNVAATVTNYDILRVIGSTSLSTAGPVDTNNPQANNLAQVNRIASFPAGVITTGPFQYGGIIATDVLYARAVYYRSPLAQTNDNGDVVFGQPSFTTSTAGPFFARTPDANTLEVTRSGPNVVFSDPSRFFIYNMSSYTDQGYPPVAQFPGIVIGDCANCTYAPFNTDGTGIAADGAGRIYFANIACAQILVWNTSQIISGRNRAEPYLALGQAAVTRSCPGVGVAGGCQDTDAGYTCMNPTVMTTDSNNGLWVYNRRSSTYLHFQAGSRLADLSLSIPGALNPSAISMGVGARSSLMAISTDNFQHIINITYSGAVPTGGTALFRFGSGGSNSTAGSSTLNVGIARGIAWDQANPDYLFVSDQSNNRVVYFTPFGGTTPASLSGVPSQTSSISISNSRSFSASRTPSPTPSISESPSNTPSTSFSSTPGLTPTASITESPSLSPQVGVNNNTNSGSSQGSVGTGSSSTLSSWVSLLF